MKLHAKIIGEGIPFIILHGFLGMGDNWKTLAIRFSKLGYQIHLVDQRNHGRSFHSEAFDYELLANDLKAYCTQNSIEKSHNCPIGTDFRQKLIGFSQCDMIGKKIIPTASNGLTNEQFQFLLDTI